MGKTLLENFSKKRNFTIKGRKEGTITIRKASSKG